MTSPDIETQVRAFLRTNFLFDLAALLAADDSLLDTGVVDSIGMLEVIQYIEVDFGIQVEDGELLPENFDSVRNLTNYVARKRGAGAVVVA